MIIALFIIFLFVTFGLVYQWFDDRYLYHLLVEHRKEWNEICSGLNLNGMTVYERNQAVDDAYMKYMDKLKSQRAVGAIKYCAFPVPPMPEPIIRKLIDGEWKEIEYADLAESEKIMLGQSEQYFKNQKR